MVQKKPTMGLFGPQDFGANVASGSISLALFILQCTNTFRRHCRKAVTIGSTPDKKKTSDRVAVIPYIRGVAEPI